MGLFKLKSWFTLNEAAQVVTQQAVGEAVKPVDLLRLGLDGHLELSLLLPDTVMGEIFRVVPRADIEFEEVPALTPGPPLLLPTKGEQQIGDDIWIRPTGEMREMGFGQIHAFPLLDSKSYYLTTLIWDELGIAYDKDVTLGGCFLRSGAVTYEADIFCRLTEMSRQKDGTPFTYPSGWFPENAQVVITRRQLDTFLALLGEGEGKPADEQQAASTKPSSQARRAENNNLRLIAALVHAATDSKQGQFTLDGLANWIDENYGPDYEGCGKPALLRKFREAYSVTGNKVLIPSGKAS